MNNKYIIPSVFDNEFLEDLNWGETKLKNMSVRGMSLAFGLILTVILGPDALCQPPQGREMRGNAVVKDVYGIAQQRKGDSGDWHKINGGDILATQTTIKTLTESAVLLQLSGGHMLRVGEKTTVTLRELGNDKSFSFHVLAGNIWSMVRKANQPTKYEVETPSAMAGVSGTIFFVSHDTDDDQTMVSTNQGTVNVRQFNGEHVPDATAVPVGDGQYAQIGRVLQSAPNLPGRPTAIFAKPQPLAMQQMWRAMHRSEGWMSPKSGGAGFKLNRNVDLQMRAARGRAPGIKGGKNSPLLGPGRRRRRRM